jgi:futalosine hydrolase
MATKLLLIPTVPELECLSDSFKDRLRSQGCELAICGFGPILSGISATRLIAVHRPNQVLLAGVAGSYRPEIEGLESVEFDEVACYGIGAGSADDFITMSELGWNQWNSTEDGLEIPEIIPLASLSARLPPIQLLTCVAASANQRDVSMRLTKFPNAVAEDMEGYAVATACRLADVPLRIVRGISNCAGDRNPAHWRIREAMLAAESQVSRILFGV